MSTIKKKRKEPDTVDWETELAETKKELAETKQRLAESEKKLAEAEALVKEMKTSQTVEDDEIDLSDDESVRDDSEAWTMKFRELRGYRILNGNCNVSQIGPNSKLGIWVRDQRVAYKGKRGKKLSPERLTMLESLGFAWGKGFAPPASWEEMFLELQKYQKAMGHCNIHINPKSPSALAKWVCVQRYEYKRLRKGKDSLLTMEQAGQLREMGFKWKRPQLTSMA